MAGISLGPKKVSHTQDKDGHREYTVTYLVKMTSVDDGPALARVAAGLPLTGSFYTFGNEVDTWAFCTPEVNVTQVITEKDRHFFVEKHFTTKPQSRCNENNIENPLLEPPKINGQSDNISEEATHNRYQQPIKNSAHEQLRGPQVEFDRHRSTVTIEQNFPTFAPIVFAYRFLDHVNDRTMWGMLYRTVCLSNVSFSRNYFGLCFAYYTRKLEFTFDARGFDKDLLDEGTKVLNGHWDDNRNWVLDPIAGASPNPQNPNHFIRSTDYQGNPIRVVLDGEGKPFVPNAPVDECDQCPVPEGAPEEWTVLGFKDELGQDVAFVLTHVVGCTWQGTSPETGNVQLEHTDGQWKLTTSDAGIYILQDNDEWLCSGPNLLNQVFQGPEVPDTITLVNLNIPGQVRVEKHPDANLFLLGVPLLL